jgi:hypothetical protein
MRLYPKMHKAASSNHHDGRLFSRKGSFFGGGSRLLPATTRLNTNVGSTTIQGSRSAIEFQDPFSLLDASLPALDTRKASLSSLTNSPQNTSNSRNPSIEIRSAVDLPQRWPLPNRSRSSSRPRTRRESISQPLTDISTQFPGSRLRKDKVSISSTEPYSRMLATSLTREHKPGNIYQNGGSFTSAAMAAPGMALGPQSPNLETITYQHISEMASKRISTLDYLRKAYVYPS